tara:strand:- start:119 stop:535 length:417 start_codon:yes stop_codon:yes gene_type:complete
MLNFFRKQNDNKKDDLSVMSLACLLIHAARIDESYTENEKKIIKETLVKLGAESVNLQDLISKAELAEKDTNQILEYTKQAKILEHEKKVILVGALWEIIYSDGNADMYEANLMRRLSGLLYLDKKEVANIKEKILNK